MGQTSNFMLGARALMALVNQQNSLDYWKSKLTSPLFQGDEVEVFQFVDAHYKKHKALPHLTTLLEKFPTIDGMEAPEVPSYYVEKLENRYFRKLLGDANLQSQSILTDDPNAIDKAEAVHRNALQEINRQRFRHRMLDFGAEGADLVHAAYFKKHLQDVVPLDFGWPYMDERTGGVLPGDIVSIVGRPAQGKTWLLLYIAIHNWLLGRKVLFVSMEMSILAIAQRLAAMYSHYPVGQLKLGQFSTSSLKGFVNKMAGAGKEEGKLYIVDGNLAASVDEIYELADHLDVDGVLIDGAYLMRHKNGRLNRYERVAENVEMMKRYAGEMPTFASWQFNREASKASKKKGGGEKGEVLENIGYSDAIGQISSIVIGLMQEESVETIEQRVADLLKGRNGEIGRYHIKWNFQQMDFAEVPKEEAVEEPLEFV